MGWRARLSRVEEHLLARVAGQGEHLEVDGERADEGVQEALDGSANPLLRGPANGGAAGRGVGGAGEVEQVHPVGLVELQGAGDSFEDVLGRSPHVSSFEPHVVLGADAGEHRQLLAPQTLHPPVAAVRRPAGLLGRDPRSSRDEELADVVPRVHVFNATAVG